MTDSIPAKMLDKFANFGELLRYLRRRAGLTQTELSIAVGYSDAQISRLEQNLRLPNIPNIQARFLPALGLKHEPAARERLLQFAVEAQRQKADAEAATEPPVIRNDAIDLGRNCSARLRKSSRCSSSRAPRRFRSRAKIWMHVRSADGSMSTRSEGSIKRAGDQLRVSVQAELLEKEKLALLGRHHGDLEAYNLYLKGRYYWAQRPQGINKAIEYFQSAKDKDPRSALARAGLADCYVTLGSWENGTLPPVQAMAKAKSAASDALQLDSRLAEAHATLAYRTTHHDWDWATAEAQFRRAFELNPNYAVSHYWYSHYLTAMGPTEESLAASKRCLELDLLESGDQYSYGGASPLCPAI